MTDQPERRVLEVEIRDEDDGISPLRCASCLEAIPAGSEYVWEPAGYGSPSMIVGVHTWCSVKNGFVLSWVASAAGDS